jgi:Protein of unknown function (DUF2867)
MKIPSSEHRSRPWRILEIVPDFRLEDVWALPAYGDASDFQALIDGTVSSDPSRTTSIPSRVVWGVRGLLGKWFGLGTVSDSDGGGQLPIPGTTETSLADRLPADLRGTAAGIRFDALPFEPLYRTDDEFAAEVSNRTVHGVLHLAWAEQGDGRYRGQLAVYVKPRGRLGEGYMALIKPFRLWIVYPALMRRIERDWSTRPRSVAD